jgi:hypothetical protein
MSSDWPIKSKTYSALDQATGYLHNRRSIRWPKVRSAEVGGNNNVWISSKSEGSTPTQKLLPVSEFGHNVE